jgi:hypothetical protein
VSGVRLVLKPSAEQQAELDQLLEDQRNPASPDYQNWLTPEQFGERFGVSENDIGKLTAWLESQGLRVEDVARARNFIVFGGTASQVSAAFRVELRSYELEGKRHFANAGEPSLPGALSGVVEGIRGLNDFRPKPYRTQKLRPAYTSGSAHYLSPDDLATIYDVMPLYQAGFDGTGQKVVIPGQTDINLADIRAFRSQFGLSAKDPQLVLAGKDPGVSQNDQIESELDVEWAGAVARNATIVFVYSPNVFTSIQYAIDQNLAPVISLSYGACEIGVPASYRSMAQQANAQGITWLSASGDSGAAGCDAQGSSAAASGPAVTFPADIPEVTAVGGTEFAESGSAGWSSSNSSTWLSASGYIPEKSWNDTAATGRIEGSGGGVSVLFAKPWWQTGPGVPNDKARDVPDVSLTASGAHDGYIICYGGKLASVGGTSAATPSFAGIVTLLNQYLVTKGVQSKPGIGNINPNLYSLAQSTPSVFHDITAGDNMVPCKAGSTGCPASGSFGYTAGAGYDLVTGLGSVDANVLVTKWTALPTGVGTTMSVTASPTSIPTTGSTTLTAKVAVVSGSAMPTGAVTFSLGSTSLGSASVSAGVATVSVKGSSLAVGSNTITTVFTASGNFSNSSGTVKVTVTPVVVATATSVAANPASIATTGATQVTVTVKAASGTAVPTGTVALTAGSKTLGSAAVSASGVATFPVAGSSLAIGVNTLTATFTATGNFGSSTGTASVTVTAPVVATTTVVAASPTSLASAASTQVTATVKTVSGTAAPAGSVALTSGNTVLGSATISSAGIATFTVSGSKLAIGANPLTATFTANGNFGNSSGTASVTVTAPAVATTTSVNASPASIASSASTQVTVTVKAASGTAMPTGSVNLSLGSASLGSAALSSSGVATFTVAGSKLVTGVNTLTAVFLAAGNFSNSTGTGTVTIAGTGVATSTTIVATPATFASTGSTQFVVTVKSQSGAAVPTGTVTVVSGSTPFGSAILSPSGTAIFVAKGSSLAAGANTITATFAGSGNFANSAGTVAVTVTAPSSAANVVVTATPKTSTQAGWPVALQLQETAGVATRVTGFSINGTDFSSVIANAFGGTQLPANGTLSAFLSIQWQPLPASVTFTFAGTDANGHAWTQSATVKTSGN